MDILDNMSRVSKHQGGTCVLGSSGTVLGRHHKQARTSTERYARWETVQE